jgi:hypothetical protein
MTRSNSPDGVEAHAASRRGIARMGFIMGECEIIHIRSWPDQDVCEC